MAKDSSVSLRLRDQIIEELRVVSPATVRHILANPNADYALCYKYITHSDLTPGGKRTDAKQGFEKNLLYYLTVAEMQALGATPVAKQSNIGVPNFLYGELGISKEKNPKVDFYLANDSVKYFTEHHTETVIENLGKKFSWKSGECRYDLHQGDFTLMQMTHAAHGFGTSADEQFQALRKNIFLYDRIYFLVETVDKTKTLYIILSKNPKFFEILKIKESPWKDFLDSCLPAFTEDQLKNADQGTTEYERRTLQGPWKERLAEEMMNYTSNGTEVFCPLTGIRGKFSDLKMLFIASHIKRHADSSIYEKYDVNNGLLLCANADALFDKYMITISEDKNIIFSELLKDETELKKNLLLDHEIISKHILNDQRMEYMKDHRAKFYEKEAERRAKQMEVPANDASHVLETPTPSSQKSTSEIISEFCVTLKSDDLHGECLPSGSRETFLIAPYDNILHKRWIIRNKIYNSLITKTDIKGASVNTCPDVIVLYDRFKVENYAAYNISGCEYIEGGALIGSPQTIDRDQSYLIFMIGNERHVSIDVNKLLRHVDLECDVEPTSKLILINN